MDSTMAMILFEWKRIRWSLLAACGILVLLFAAAGLWPGEKSMRSVGIVIVAVPALLVPALFGSLAADRGEWPFLLGLPYPASKLFLLRLLLRVLILLPAVSLFSLTGVLLLEEGITMAFLQVLPIVLLENLAIAVFRVSRPGAERARSPDGGDHRNAGSGSGAAAGDRGGGEFRQQ